MNDHIISFEPRKRLIEKARAYLDDVERFLEEFDTALTLLLRVLKIADPLLQDRIMLMLGGIGGTRVVWPLYAVMSDPEADDTLRHRASIQLNVTAAMLEDPTEITDRLTADLAAPDPVIRRHAAFALGWKGNARAALPLIERLYDTDEDVQQAAVNALGNLEDDRILGLMLDRLDNGPPEQQRVILYNLWRFDSRKTEVIDVYRRYLQHRDLELRCAALELICLVSEAEPETVVPVMKTCLVDPSVRLRKQALRLMREYPALMQPSIRRQLDETAREADPEISRLAAALLKRHD